MRVRGKVVSLLVVAALAITAAGCSSSSSDGGGSGGGGGGSDALKLAALYQIKGESSYAVDDYYNGFKLAVDEINSQGGFNGKPVESYRVTADPLDLQKTQQAFLQAMNDKPDAIVGFPLEAQIQGLATQITRNKVPVLGTQAAEPPIAYGAESGSEYYWTTGTFNPEVIAVGIDYLVKDLGLKKIGVMGSNDSFGSTGTKAASQELKHNSLEPFSSQSYDPTATDLTKQVLAMKGADAVLNWGFPNPTLVFLKQLKQNGLNVPAMISTGASTNYKNGGFADVGEVYIPSVCSTDATDADQKLKDFLKAYEAAFHTSPNGNAAQAYDAVFVLVAAAKKAGSTDPVAINKALAEVSVTGACGVYHSDGAHFLNHQAVVAHYPPGGKAPVTLVKKTTVAEVPKGGVAE